VANNDAVVGWMSDQLLKVMRTHMTVQIVRNGWPILGLSAYTPEIEQTVLEGGNQLIDPYGLLIARMGNFDVNLSEQDEAQLKTLAKDTAYSRLAGSFNAYAAGEAALGAGQGMAQGGGSTEGAFLAAGIGAMIICGVTSFFLAGRVTGRTHATLAALVVLIGGFCLFTLFGLVGREIPVAGSLVLLGLIGLFKLMSQFEIRRKPSLSDK